MRAFVATCTPLWSTILAVLARPVAGSSKSRTASRIACSDPASTSATRRKQIPQRTANPRTTGIRRDARRAPPYRTARIAAFGACRHHCATRHMGNTFDRAHGQHSSASPKRYPPPSACWMTRCSEERSDEGQLGSQLAAPSRGGLRKRIVRLVTNFLRATVRAHG